VPIKSNLRQYNKLKAALVAMAVTMQDYRVTDADIAVWIREFDKDGDGLISRSEFSAGMTHWVLEHTRGDQHVPKTSRISTQTVGLYKLNPVDPWLESALDSSTLEPIKR
jgi:hypothetical protein